jgi:hypothetical protein
MARSTSGKPLPDRWDFDKWRNGRRLNPPRGPKVGIRWGDLLTLEYLLREAEKNLARAEQELVQLHDHLNEVAPPDPDEPPSMLDDPSLALARDAVRNVEFILGELRRSERWPGPDHPSWPPQQVVIHYGASSEEDRRSLSDDEDPDIPF